MFSEAYDQSYIALKEGNLVRVSYEKDRRTAGKYLAKRIEVIP